MADRAPFDWEATTLRAGTFGGVEHFFVGKDGAEVGTKPDGFLIHIGEALFEKLHKDPLRPLEVARIGCVYLAVPVVSESELGQLFGKVGDVLLSSNGGVGTRFDRVLLGR